MVPDASRVLVNNDRLNIDFLLWGTAVRDI